MYRTAIVLVIMWMSVLSRFSFIIASRSTSLRTSNKSVIDLGRKTVIISFVVEKSITKFAILVITRLRAVDRTGLTISV